MADGSSSGNTVTRRTQQSGHPVTFPISAPLWSELVQVLARHGVRARPLGSHLLSGQAEKPQHVSFRSVGSIPTLDRNTMSQLTSICPSFHRLRWSSDLQGGDSPITASEESGRKLIPNPKQCFHCAHQATALTHCLPSLHAGSYSTIH